MVQGRGALACKYLEAAYTAVVFYEYYTKVNHIWVLHFYCSYIWIIICMYVVENYLEIIQVLLGKLQQQSYQWSLLAAMYFSELMYFPCACIVLFCRQDSELVQNAQLSKAKLLLYLLIL